MTGLSSGALAELLNPHRRDAALRELTAFESFCVAAGMPPVAEAVPVYLLSQPDQSGVQVRAAVARLDLAALLTDAPPPGRNALVRQFLRGCYKMRPLGPTADLCDPLYPGDVRALVDQIVRPTWQQLRDHAYLLTMNESGLRWVEMNRLTWQDLDLKPSTVTIHTRLRKGNAGPRPATIVIPRRRSDLLCAVRALHLLRESGSADPSRSVFSTRGGNVKTARLRKTASVVEASRSGPQLLGTRCTDDVSIRGESRRLLAMTAMAQRDRLLILLGFLAALTPAEAMDLRVGHVRITTRGLVIHIPGRPHQDVGVPAAPASPYCPVRAWRTWRRTLTSGTGRDERSHAFVSCTPYLPNLGREPLAVETVSDIVARRARDAGLVGHFTYSSLKEGFIRAAVIAETPHHDIAAHVGHRTLVGIRDRELEETAMSGSILRLIAL